MTVNAYNLHKDAWKYQVGIEDVTFTPNTGDPTADAGNAVSEAKAKRVLAMKPARSGVEWTGPASDTVDSGLQVWILYDNTLGGLTPHTGAKITDADGVVWIVESCQDLTERTRWKCVCSKAKA